MLSAEDRRVFISYSHADAAHIAERLFGLLSKLRFDVFLGRFRLNPGVDFIEPIADELIDKAMIVVVETPHAVHSTWVRHEVATAVKRRLGLAAIHLQSGPTIGEIDERARCRVDNDDAIAASCSTSTGRNCASGGSRCWNRSGNLCHGPASALP